MRTWILGSAIRGSASILLAASAASVYAADAAGDCCSDLDERIAELSATSARKGNRAVSLTISGWINEAVFFWDDGVENNVYVGTNSLEQTRFRFLGEARIGDGWSAGYTLEVGVSANASNGFSQLTDKGGAPPIVRKSNWFLKHSTLGKLTVGLEGEATYHLLDSANATNTMLFANAESPAVALGAFRLRTGGELSALRWTDIMRGGNNSTPGQGGRRNIVRYDSPTNAGFTLTASWGEDDLWSGALRYAGQAGDFKLLANAGYANNTDENMQLCHVSPVQQDCAWWGAAATVMHVPTGLYMYGGFGAQEDETRGESFPALDVEKDDRIWFVQTGIERKFWALGKSTVFAQYRHDDAGSNPDRTIAGSFIRASDIDHWSAGVVQNIETADMDLYVTYDHASAEVTNGAGITVDVDDFSVVQAGAMIKF